MLFRVLSLLVGALCNIVDQIFIANASYLGSYGNAANTVVFPLTVVALAIAVMIGDGCCAFVSMALGRNKPEQAQRRVARALAEHKVPGGNLRAECLTEMRNQDEHDLKHEHMHGKHSDTPRGQTASCRRSLPESRDVGCGLPRRFAPTGKRSARIRKAAEPPTATTSQ